jgi:hypothetical protein
MSSYYARLSDFLILPVIHTRRYVKVFKPINFRRETWGIKERATYLGD